MKPSGKSLYFVALVPAPPLYDELMAIKEDFRQCYHSKAALRSPPHITLYMPFKWRPEREGLLRAALDRTAGHHAPFTVQLSGFGAFPPRVIYIQVAENPALGALQAAVLQTVRQQWKLSLPVTARPFVPHLTVAFRDLRKAAFHRAWEEYRHKPFEAGFAVEDVCLLRHDGQRWQVVHRAQLANG